MMKKLIALLTTFIFTFSLLPAIPTLAAEREVSPGVGTLAQAVSAASSGDTLLLGNGTYHVTSTLYINKTLTIKAKPGTSPVITGSTPLTGWESVGGGIYRTVFSGTALPMLTENGQMAVIARWPNKPASANFTDGYIFADSGSAGRLTFSETLPSGVTATNLQLIGWGSGDTNWTNTLLPVTSITQGTITYSGSMIYGCSKDTRFYIRGHKALIDVPGEYAIDGGYLYYYPYNSNNLDKISSALGFGAVLQLSAQNIRLEGLGIKGTAYSSQSSTGKGGMGDNPAVTMVSTGGVINACTFDAIGSHAIAVGGTRNTVSNSVITNAGVSGVILTGTYNRVYNNSVSKTGLEMGGGAAISINSSYNTVDHNEIFDHPRWGINITYGNLPGNVIEYNELYNCNTDSQDTGLIYTFKTVANAENPNIIRYNHLHDSYIYGGMGFGIYLDDDTTYARVYGNLLNNLGNRNQGYLSAPIMIKGSYHEVYNNIMANNDNLASKRDHWNNSAMIILQQLQTNYTTKDNRVYKNVFYENENNTMWRVMNASSNVDYRTVMNYCDQNVYYANVRGGANSYAGTKYYVNAGGCWCDVRQTPWKNYWDKNSYFDQDPGFVDGLNNDFRLKSNSILRNIGFEELPLSQMGRILSADVPTQEPTPVPTATPIPTPTPVPTPVPPTTPPVTTPPDYNNAILTMDSSIYRENGSNTSNTTFNNGTLTMTKTNGGMTDILVWSNNATQTVNTSTVYTIKFSASVSNCEPYNSNNGYSVNLRARGSSDTYKLLSLFPLESGNTGITFESGTGAITSVSPGMHNYEIVYNSSTVNVYCDGVLVATKTNLGFPGNLHAYQIQCSHGDATGCTLVMNHFRVYPGDTHTIPAPSLKIENVVWFGNTFTANAKGENLEKNKNLTLCTVSYNGNNRISGLTFTPVSTDANGNLNRNFFLYTTNRHIKVFLWDVTSITPLSPVAEYRE